ncbi:hypothetical protein [Sphingomonas sp. IW22]|uniref:hypothetical protein n=1 Tax=Sphingomonas sp. IW22 TaxID=3242489 RepID=UPI003520B990
MKFKMNTQFNKNEHLRHVLLYQFNCHVNATQAARNINAVYGEGCMSSRVARKWFSKFKKGDFSLTDAPRSGRPSHFSEECLSSLLKADNRQTTRELAGQLSCNPQTVLNHLHRMRKFQKYGAWIPHHLNERNKNQRINACSSLLARHHHAVQQHRPFLSLLVTGDEKWCLYINMKHRKEWVDKDHQAKPRVKQDNYSRKVMLCVWWGIEGVIYWELLKRNVTITAAIYVQQLKRVAQAISQKRPNSRHKLILQHDNARPHIAKMTISAIQELNWEILQHPPYSPDIAPSDFYLFRAVANDLRGVTFDCDEDVRIWLEEWFSSKDQAFYRYGIEKLPKRWETVINNKGEYIID